MASFPSSPSGNLTGFKKTTTWPWGLSTPTVTDLLQHSQERKPAFSMGEEIPGISKECQLTERLSPCFLASLNPQTNDLQSENVRQCIDADIYMDGFSHDLRAVSSNPQHIS